MVRRIILYNSGMCGRAYHTYTDEELALRYLHERAKRHPLATLKPNYNLSPTHLSPIVRVEKGERVIKEYRWGLVPGWAKDLKSASKYSLINARGEEIAEKRTYAGPYKNRRCIVPLSGFVEWKREGDSKRPFAIYLKDQSIMSVAGIWEEWTSRDDGEIIHSFAVITTGANDFMSNIHDRMPVILTREDEDEWLDPGNRDTAQLGKLLKPCPNSWLKTHEISTRVNSPKNNYSELLEPITRGKK